MSSLPVWFAVDKCFIDGRWVAPSTGQYLPLEDPSRGVEIGKIARGGAADIDAAVAAAERALAGPWGKLTAAERGRLMLKLSHLIVARATTNSRNSKRATPASRCSQAQADAAALARYFEFYAGAADKLHGETLPYQDGYTVFTVREPHGVTGHIVPWNYPMQIFGRSVGGGARGGQRLRRQAGGGRLPVGARGRRTGRRGGLAGRRAEYRHRLRPRSGRGARAASGHRPHLVHRLGRDRQAGRRWPREKYVPVTLELGGKSPQIVFADADLDAALPLLVNAVVQNAGQTCSAGSRVLIERSIYEQVLLSALGARFSALRVGPAHADLDCGPLIRARSSSASGFLADAHHDAHRRRRTA